MSQATTTRSFGRAVGLTTAASLLAMLLNLGTGLLVARLLAPVEYGRLVFFANLLLTGMLLFGFGLTTYVAGEAARNRAATHDDTGRRLAPILGLRLCSVLPLLLLGLAATVLLGEPLYLAAALGAALAVLLDFCAGLMQGAGRTGAALLAYLAQPLLYLGMLAALPAPRADGVALTLLASYALALLLAAATLARVGLARRPRLDRVGTTLQRALRGAGPIYLLALGQLLYGSVALIWLGATGRYIEAALLGVSLTVVRMLPLAVSPVVATVLYPRLCAAAARGARNELAALVALAFEAVAVLAAVGVALLVAYPGPVLALLYGPAYQAAALPLAVLAPLCLALAVDQLLALALLARGRVGAALSALALRLALFALAAGLTLAVAPVDATLPLALAYLGSAVVALLFQLAAYLRPDQPGAQAEQQPCPRLPLLRPLAFLALCLAVAAGCSTLLPQPAAPALARIVQPLVVGAALSTAGAAMLIRAYRPRLPARHSVAVRRLPLLALLALLVGLATPPAAAAATPPASPPAPGPTAGLERCDGTLLPPNRVALLCAPGPATARDRIDIYLRGALDPNRPWREQPLAEDAVWVFTEGDNADGRTMLLIDFYRDGATLVADLYADVDGDRSVAWFMERGVPRPLEANGTHSLRVLAADGWWQRDGIVNYNLRMELDGPIRGSFGAGFLYDYRSLLRTDRRVDFSILVRDSDNDGRPDYELRQDLPPLPEDPTAHGYYRSHLMVNPEDDELPASEFLLWPHLSGQAPGALIRERFTPHAPIQIDWANARIAQVAEFVASRHNPGSYFVYSIARIEEGRHNRSNFESPFAYYDLAAANDRYPTMSIRKEITLPGEIVETRFRNPEPLNLIELSWDEDHSQQWDYGLTLVNRQPISSTIALPDLSLEAVPPAELPGWVANQRWDAATFVEVEIPYYNNEVIYEYSLELGQKALTNRYLQGLSDAPPTAAFQDAPIGFRAEYAFDLNRQPYLYLSPVDGRLHLSHADGGVWRIDAERTLRSANLDGDGYLDQWRLEDHASGQPLQQLSLAPTAALFAANGTVALRQVAVEPALFTALPPTDRTSWRTLRDRTAAAALPFAPGDLQAMFNRLDGPLVTIRGAALQGYRPTDTGFRFALRLDPGFRVQGRDLLGLRELAPGDYLVVYDGDYRVTPLTPPQPVVELSAAPPSVGRASALTLLARNDGLADLHDVTMEVWAQGPASEPQLIERRSLDLLAGNNLAAPLSWTPQRAGSWQLWLTLQASDAPPTTLAPTTVEVAANAAQGQLLLGSASAPLAALGLLGVATIALALTISTMRRTAAENQR